MIRLLIVVSMLPNLTSCYSRFQSELHAEPHLVGANNRYVVGTKAPGYNQTTGWRPFHGQFFEHLYYSYAPIHSYLSIVVCLFSSLANFINIIVLTRKKMLSPTNVMLASIALAELLVVIDYIPLTLITTAKFRNLLSERKRYETIWWTRAYTLFAITFHNIATWLIVVLAGWRYLSVKFPLQAKSLCTMPRVVYSIFATYVAVPLFCIPLYLSSEVYPVRVMIDNKITIRYVLRQSYFARNTGLRMQFVTAVLSAVVLKLIPCILMAYLSLSLIVVIVRAERKRRKFKSIRNPEPPVRIRDSTLTELAFATLDSDDSEFNVMDAVTESKVQPTFVSYLNRIRSSWKDSWNLIRSKSFQRSDTRVSREQQRQERRRKRSARAEQSERTTTMLLVILILYYLSEIPAGLCYIFVGIFGDPFLYNVYQYISILVDMLQLFNSSVIFILLVIMSRMYRQTFRHTILRCNRHRTHEVEQ